MYFKKEDYELLKQIKQERSEELLKHVRGLAKSDKKLAEVLNKKDLTIFSIKKALTEKDSIIFNLIADRMDDDPTNIITFKEPIVKHMLFENKRKEAVCERAYKFDNEVFYLYVSKDGINTALIIRQERGNEGNQMSMNY